MHSVNYINRPVNYWQADHLCKIDPVYDGADSITLNWFNEVLYKLLYYSIHDNPVNFVFVWVPVTRDEVVKVKEPLHNHSIKQQQKVERVYFHIFCLFYKNAKVR